MNREKIIHLGRLFGMDGESATGIVDFFYYFFFPLQGGEGGGENAADVGLLCLIPVEM